MDTLIPALVTKMQHPIQQYGRTVIYVLDHIQSGQRLRSTDTLQEAGVDSGDDLRLLPELTAGGFSRMRERRLAKEYKQLKSLEQNSDFIVIEHIKGNPPEEYDIVYTCIGIEDVDHLGPKYKNRHRVSIKLPVEYPTRQPLIRWLTLIFHPNINPEGTEVCNNLDTWNPTMSLVDLCLMIGGMIQYKFYNPHQPLRLDAAKWALENKHMLPIDNRALVHENPNDIDIHVLISNNDEFEIRLI